MGNWLKSGLFSSKPRGNKGELEIPPMPSYKKYVALLTQSGTDAPVATVIENNIGDIQWSYDTVGTYFATLADAFPLNKTIVLSLSSGVNVDIICYNNEDGSPSNSLALITTLSGLETNGQLYNTPIEIRVYN